jgi:hypothetical protein
VSDANRRTPLSPRWSWLWGVAFVALIVWTANRLGAFDWWATVSLPGGGAKRIPLAFGTVDHPFHTIRAELLLDAWRHFHSLRWVYEHQGGYPAEFYPFGAAAIDVVGWVLTFGALPMALVHKLVVIVVFLAPSLGFWLIGRKAGLSAGAAFVATAAQIAVRGQWWSGGSQVLVEWGMVTNVAAATELLIALPFLATAALAGSQRQGAVAGALAALSLYSNPRSFIALAAIGSGCVIAALLDRPTTQRGRTTAVGVALAGAATLLLAAPEIISLARFNHLYFFVRYSWYADLHAYYRSSVAAVSTPVFIAGLVGLALALLLPRHAVVRAAGLSLLIYIGATTWFVLGLWPSGFAEQLETTRLMPFQRLLWLAMAGYGVYVAADQVRRFGQAWLREAALAAVGAALIVAYVAAPIGAVPVSDRGLVKLPTIAQPGIADLETAVEAADAKAPQGTAILVIGTTLSWHDQLWAAQWTNRPLFFNDWLWYWQTENFGVYNPKVEHDYPDPATALTADYFSHHGIGAVVVTGAAEPAAADSPLLSNVREGTYNVYTVNDPVDIVTFGGVNATSFSISGDHISATGSSSGGAIVVRRNWFPRWQATVNGQPAAVTETEDGYMQIAAPAGPVTLELRYVVDGWDWLGRALAGLGVLVCLVALAPSRWFRPIARRARR